MCPPPISGESEHKEHTKKKLDIAPTTRRIGPRFWATLILATGLLQAGCDGDVHHDFSRVTGPNTIIGSGNVVSETRTVGGYSGVSLSGAGRLIIDRNGFDSLTITAEENVLPHLTSQVSGSLLALGIAPGVSVSTSREILYEVSARTLEELRISGAGDAEVMGIDSRHFRVVISGAGNITAFGEADEQDLTISGAGRYDAAGVDSRITTITVSGAGFARVRVSGQLNVNISGTGTVEYYGDPVLNVSGDGSVRRMGP